MDHLPTEMGFQDVAPLEDIVDETASGATEAKLTSGRVEVLLTGEIRGLLGTESASGNDMRADAREPSRPGMRRIGEKPRALRLELQEYVEFAEAGRRERERLATTKPDDGVEIGGLAEPAK